MKKLLFNERPEGTKYTEGMWSYVPDEQAAQYIEDGLAEEYDPEIKQTKEPEPQPEPLPEDLPGRNHFEDAGLSFEQVKELHESGELQSVGGIGDSTEIKIQNYFD